jgi:hypothetical protein
LIHDVLYPVLTELGKYLIWISPTVIGVMVGGFIVQRYWVKKANESAMIEYLTKELNDLVDETLEYWSIDCSGGNGVEDRRRTARKLEPKIKGALHNINSVLKSYSTRYCSRSYCKNVDFNDLMSEVMNACTGGNFEGEKRAAEPHRFLSVVNTTHRVRSHLFERRV